MTTLTTDDFTWIKNWIKASPTHNDVLRSSGLSKTQVYAAIQAIEDYSVGSYSVTPSDTLRAAINTATSATPTTAQNQALWYSWAAWRGATNQ